MTDRPALLRLTSIQDLLDWYRQNLCNTELRDPRGYRVRFNLNDFVHFIKLTNKYGDEPRNRRKAIEQISRGRIVLKPGRFDPQRAQELSWAVVLATRPDLICRNWQVLGEGDECYIKNFGGGGNPNKYRVLVCKIIGMNRQALTIFPSDIGGKERAFRIWP